MAKNIDQQDDDEAYDRGLIIQLGAVEVDWAETVEVLQRNRPRGRL